MHLQSDGKIKPLSVQDIEGRIIFKVAERKGLEPSASGVTGRRYKPT